MIANLIGYVLCFPNALSVMVLCVSSALVGVQARLEEAHLRSLHGEAFDTYQRQVPRWL